VIEQMVKLVDFNTLGRAVVFRYDVMISFVEGRIKSAKELRYTKFTFMVAEIDCRVKYYRVLIGVAQEISGSSKCSADPWPR